MELPFPDHLSAFDHFLAWYRANHTGRIPTDIQEAKYASEGKRRAALGPERVRRLLEKYGEGKYKCRLDFAFDDAA